jgi:hypothetical protein
MHEVFDLEGVLVGWIGYSKAAGRDVFVPHRDEDINSDRRADRQPSPLVRSAWSAGSASPPTRSVRDDS